jgi:hypothetical protein
VRPFFCLCSLSPHALKTKQKPNTTPVFPEELSEDGALDIVTPRIVYCLIQVRRQGLCVGRALQAIQNASHGHPLTPLYSIHPSLSQTFPSQLAGLGAALYKLHTMGLLPTHAADYAAYLAPAAPAEFAGGGSVVLGS